VKLFTRRELAVALISVLGTCCAFALADQKPLFSAGRVYNWNSIPVTKTDVGEARQFFRAPHRQHWISSKFTPRRSNRASNLIRRTSMPAKKSSSSTREPWRPSRRQVDARGSRLGNLRRVEYTARHPQRRRWTGHVHVVSFITPVTKQLEQEAKP